MTAEPRTCTALGLVFALTLAASGRAEPAADRAPSAAEPTNTAASRAFDEGLAAFTRSDHEAAARAFERAFVLSQHPFAAYNAALAWRKVVGARTREADALWLSLSKPGLEPSISSRASARLSELRRDLAFVEVLGPTGSAISIGHREDAELPATLHLEPGRVELRARAADGRRIARTIEARPGVASTIDLSEALTPTPIAETPEEDSTLAILGFTGLGLGVALGGAAIGMGVAALDARDAFDAGGQESPRLRERAITLRTGTNVAAFSGGALALTGVVLLVAWALDENETAVIDTGGLGLRF